MIQQFIELIDDDMLPDLVADPEVWFNLQSDDIEQQMHGVMVAFVCHINRLTEDQLRMIPELINKYGPPTFYKWEDPVGQVQYDTIIELARRAGRPIIKL
jgi:hypothetical protein